MNWTTHNNGSIVTHRAEADKANLYVIEGDKPKQKSQAMKYDCFVGTCHIASLYFDEHMQENVEFAKQYVINSYEGKEQTENKNCYIEKK